MDIKIEAPNHKNQESLIAFYEEKLNKKYAMYDFIKAMDVKVKLESDGKSIVSLQCKPEKGQMLFASDKAETENKALTEAIRKMNVQIEKYKAVHYHS